MKKFFRALLFSAIIAAVSDSCHSPKLGPEFKILKIVQPVTKEELYLKKEFRGLSYEAVYLSKDSSHSYNRKKDFYFNDPPLFYKCLNDTLFIKCSSYESPENSEFISKIECSVFKENIDYVNFKKGNKYKSLGYSIFE